MGPLFRARGRHKADALIDHLVGACKHRHWYVEAERFRGLEVDDQLVLGRRLYRQVGGLLALEDAIDVARRASERVDRGTPMRRMRSSGCARAASGQAAAAPPSTPRNSRRFMFHPGSGKASY